NTAWSTVNHAVTEEECAQLCRLPLLVLQQHVQSSLASADDHPEHISALEQVALDMELKRKLLATQRNLMESEVTSEMLAEFQPSREETEDYQRSACQATIEKLATQQGFLATAPANNPEALKAWFDPIYHMALVATTYLASSSTELALCDSEAERADMIEKRRQIACFLSWAGPFCGTRLHSAVRHSYMCAAKIPGYDSVETWLLSTLHSLRLDIASRLASRYGSHGENFVINSLVQKGFIQGEHLSTLDSTTLTPTSKQVDAWHRAAFDIYASEIDSYLFNALKTSAYAGAPAVEHLMDWWPSRMSKTYLHSFREQLTRLAEECPMYAEKVLEDNGLFSPETSLGVRRALLNKLWEAEKQAELAKKPYARLRELAREKSNRVLVEANKEGIRLASIEGAEDEIEYAAKKAWMTNAELPKAYEEVLKELQSCNASACKEKLKSLEIEWDLHQAFDMLLDDNKWEGFRAQRWLAQGFSEDGTPSFRARVALLIYAGVMEVDEGFKDYLG
ncbi:MAG: hypothetical protein KDK78_03700, partial [Chlamydiia bacterium]|nr:hypothetical protein [Chlamydiia bacterium]